MLPPCSLTTAIVAVPARPDTGTFASNVDGMRYKRTRSRQSKRPSSSDEGLFSLRTRRLRAAGLLAIGRVASITACDSRGRHGQRGQPYQARYDSGHEFSHRKLPCERDSNIGPAAHAFKQTSIESTDRCAHSNA